jgi:triosephosphate isomerase
MPAKRRLMAGTGWKMNHSVAATRAYAQALRPLLVDLSKIDAFVLPPFTALQSAAEAFAGTGIGIGGQNMHWAPEGAWTGEISAMMLAETGCTYVELAHSERLAHFGETYALVRQKLERALTTGLQPILCIGELAHEKAAGQGFSILVEQLQTALAGIALAQLPKIVVAYEPRWAIGGSEAASPAYVADQHGALRDWLSRRFGAEDAAATRIIYGGSVSMNNAEALIRIADVDGLFVGRAAWTAEGFAQILSVVVAEARHRQAAGL